MPHNLRLNRYSVNPSIRLRPHSSRLPIVFSLNFIHAYTHTHIHTHSLFLTLSLFLFLEPSQFSIRCEVTSLFLSLSLFPPFSFCLCLVSLHLIHLRSSTSVFFSFVLSLSFFLSPARVSTMVITRQPARKFHIG